VEFIPYDSVELATQHHVNGIIEVGLTDEEVDRLNELPNIPTVLINKTSTPESDYYCVCSDHYEEARGPIEHLIDHGHQQIALISRDSVKDLTH